MPPGPPLLDMPFVACFLGSSEGKNSTAGMRELMEMRRRTMPMAVKIFLLSVLLLFLFVLPGPVAGESVAEGARRQLKGRHHVPTTLEGPFRPEARRFDRSLRRGSDDLPMDHPRLAKRVPSPFPEQIALAVSSPTSMWVSWVTGNLRNHEHTPPPPSPQNEPSLPLPLGLSCLIVLLWLLQGIPRWVPASPRSTPLVLGVRSCMGRRVGSTPSAREGPPASTANCTRSRAS